MEPGLPSTLDILCDVLGIAAAAVMPVLAAYVVKAYRRLQDGWDTQRAQQLDRLAAGFLEEILSSLGAEEKPDPVKLTRDLSLRMKGDHRTPTKNESVIKRVAGVAVRKALRLAGGPLLDILS